MGKKYVIINKEIAIEQGIVGASSGRRVSKDGKLLCLVTDDLKRVDSNVEKVAKDLGATIVSHKEALKIIKEKF